MIINYILLREHESITVAKNYVQTFRKDTAAGLHIWLIGSPMWAGKRKKKHERKLINSLPKNNNYRHHIKLYFLKRLLNIYMQKKNQ